MRRAAINPLLVVVVGLAFVAACTQTTHQSAPAVATVAPPKPAPEIIIRPLLQEKEPVAEIVAKANVAPPPEPQEPPNPDKLLGLDGHAVAQLLGPANFVRRDRGVEIWQYASKQCVLDVFLYPEATGLTVTHFDLRAGKLEQRRREACYGDLVTRQTKSG